VIGSSERRRVTARTKQRKEGGSAKRSIA